MNKPPSSAAWVQQWVAKAENDLKNAEHTLRMDPQDCPYDTVCYHAQQCAEKYLKAFLVSLNADFPKIHDIGELLALLPIPHNQMVSVEEAEKLSDYATSSRYPSDPDPLTSVEASSALSITHKIRTAVRQQLL